MAKSKKAAKPAKKSVQKKSVQKKSAKPASKKPGKPVAKKATKASSKAKVNSSKIKKPAKKLVAKSQKPPSRKVNKVESRIVKPTARITARVHGKAIVKPINRTLNSAMKGKEVSGKTRYSDNELKEFKDLILEKLEAARNELKYLQDQISHQGDNNTSDTENTFASSDDGSTSMEREYLTQMAARQRLYIDHLDKALVRIQNKTYGICRVTGKLIEKERLRAVPHATLSMEAKLMQGHPQHSQNV